jgi:hypothetical protein
MNWRLSDGTTVALGGEVVGFSEAAMLLRDGIAAVRAGLPLTVSVHPAPGGDVQLDPDDPVTLDFFVRNVARMRGAEVVGSPDIEIPPDPRGELPEPEADEVN